MKKSITVLTALVMFVSMTAFAGGEEKINPLALKTFKKEFKGASDVRWTEGSDLIKAGFVLNESRVEAYFNSDGELVGTARNVLFTQLPLAVLRQINNRFGDPAVYDIVEYNNSDETFYHMTVETADKKINLKVLSTGGISVLKKIRK